MDGEINRAGAPVLLVDDEEVIVLALGELLRQAGYHVVALSEPAAALAQLKTREFSVVVSDQRMPGVSGLELLAEARRLQPNATRILITGVLDLNTMIEAINQGEIFRFVVKPWLAEEFLATVSNGAQRYELLCQNQRLQAATQEINQRLTTVNQALAEKIQTVAAQNQQLADLNRALEENFNRSLTLSVETLEEFYPSLGAQARCVAKVCHSIAEEAQLGVGDCRALERAAHFYDLGLIGLPRHLIRRWQETPEELSAEERDLVQQHPIFSQQVLDRCGTADEIGRVIRAHHERFDGQGFPDRLKGEASPWLARLLAIAVSYAGSPAPPAQALQQIRAAAGTRFDPEAVRVVLRALPQAGLPTPGREIPLKDLAPGMILARAIYSHNGVLLIPEGARLNPAYLEKLADHNRSHPLPQSLLVYC